MADLYDKFVYLPEKIQDWLGSDKLSFAIGEFNEKLKLPLEKQNVVASLVLRLTVCDIAPENLISEIMTQLEYDFAKAKELTLEIEEKLLKPMRAVLKTELDIDIDLIKEGKEKPKIEAKKPVISEALIPEFPIFKEVPTGIPIIKKEAAPAPLPISEMKLPEAEKPFVLHEEKPEIKAMPEAPRPSFTFKSEIPLPPPPPKPTTAKIERQ